MGFLRNQCLHVTLQNFGVYHLLGAFFKKKRASPITLTFCELNSRRFISWSLIKLVLSQIFIFSFHNLSSNICPSRTPVPLMLFSELHVNVFVLDYFSPEVIVFIFSSQKIMLLSVLELYVFLINDWNVSRLRMLCNSNNVFIFSCRSGLKTCVLANTRTKYFFFFKFELVFALNVTCLQPFSFSTPNLAEQLQRLIYLEGW